MAVSGKTAAPHEIPYFLDGDKPPNMAAVTKAMADRLHSRLGAIDLSQLVAGAGNNGKLVIVNSGAAAYTAMKGDATLAADGTLTIGAKKVVEAMLADKGVTAAKINDKAITLTKLAEALGLTEGYFADGAVTSRKTKLTSGELKSNEPKSIGGEEVVIPGTTLNITPAVPSILVVNASFYIQGTSTGGGNLRAQAHGTVQVDEEPLSQVVRYYADIVTGGTIRGSYARSYRIPLTAAAHTIRLGAVADSLVSSEVKVLAGDTGYTYELFAS